MEEINLGGGGKLGFKVGCNFAIVESGFADAIWEFISSIVSEPRIGLLLKPE